jgi:hypothetical protein
MAENNFAEKNRGKRKQWSIMVYLAGANDISDEARESLLQMKQVGSTEHIHVIAQFDSGSEGAFTKRYYLSPFRNAMGIETLLRQASAEIPATTQPYDSTASMNYCHRLKAVLTPSQLKRLETLQMAEMVDLLRHSPNRFKRFVLDCILDEDVYPRPSGNLGETNAGDPDVLVKFIQWAKVRYPANHYMVILWGHGSGLSVAWDYPSSPLIGSQDALTIKELKEAFSKVEAAYLNEEHEYLKDEAQQKAGGGQGEAERLPKKAEEYKLGIDIVGFNSCSLGTIEVCCELSGLNKLNRPSDLVKFVVASEGFTPKTSWPYDKILKALDEALEETPDGKRVDYRPQDFANKIVEEYIEHYKKPVNTVQRLQEIEREANRLGASLDMNMDWGQYTSSADLYKEKTSVDLSKEKTSVDLSKEKTSVDLSKEKTSVDLASQALKVRGGIDLSVCNLDKSDRVAKAMHELVDQLLGKPRHCPMEDKEIFAAVLSAHAISQSYFNRDFTDLYDFCRALRSFCSAGTIADCCKKVMDGILAMCDADNHGIDVENSYGVSIFFPWGEWDKPDVIARYKKLEFTKATGWDNFLRTYRKLAHQFEKGSGPFKDSKKEAISKAKKRMAAAKVRKRAEAKKAKERVVAFRARG